jgi:hypothetical protein
VPNAPNAFQVTMMESCYADCPSSFFWFLGQFFPITCGITQFMLRYRFLEGDMSKYSCFQGHFDCCCCKSGQCYERDCPHLCLFTEACVCNNLALSATRFATQLKYDLRTDPCDYRLIWCNNALMWFSCICNIIAIFDDNLRQVARILDLISDIMYHTVSGCMTAQVAYELNFQHGKGGKYQETNTAVAEPVDPTYYPSKA